MVNLDSSLRLYPGYHTHQDDQIIPTSLLSAHSFLFDLKVLNLPQLQCYQTTIQLTDNSCLQYHSREVLHCNQDNHKLRLLLHPKVRSTNSLPPRRDNLHNHPWPKHTLPNDENKDEDCALYVPNRLSDYNFDHHQRSCID